MEVDPLFCGGLDTGSAHIATVKVVEAGLKSRVRLANRVGLGVTVVLVAASWVLLAYVENHTSVADGLTENGRGTVIIALFLFGLAAGVGTRRLMIGRRAEEIRSARLSEAEAQRSLARRKAESEAERLRLEQQRRDVHERLAGVPGTPEWEARRRSARIAAVLEHTGVSWRNEYYSAARSPMQRRARDLMRQLEGEDRRLMRGATQAATDARIRTGSVSSARAAELAMADWMRDQGFAAVVEAALGADGGVDITANGAVAQVKFWREKAVGRPTIQQLHGAADGERCLVFAFDGGGFSKHAVVWAEDHDVALFIYNEHGAVVRAETTAAQQIEAAGQMWRS